MYTNQWFYWAHFHQRRLEARRRQVWYRTLVDGAELRQRLQHYEDQLVKTEQCRPGDLLTFVAEAGAAAGYALDLTTWVGPAIQMAVDQTKAFKECLSHRTGARQGAA